MRVRGCQDRGGSPGLCTVENGTQRHHAGRHRHHPGGPRADEGRPHCLGLLPDHYPAEAAAVLDQYNALESAPVEKHGKKGNKIIELKQHIPQVAYTAEGDAVRIELCLPASQELNLNPSLLTGFLEESSACRPPVQASCAQSSSPRTSSCLPEPGRMAFT